MDITTKKCGKCNIEKLLKDFRTMKDNRPSKKSTYLCSMCKNCEKIMALERYHKNPEENNERNQQWKKDNSEKVKITAAKYFQENKDDIRRKRRDYMKAYYLNNREKINERMIKYLNTNIGFKLRNSARRRILDCITKNKSTVEYLGTSIDIVKKWLEFNFDDNMSWENYGSYWHIDHTLPVSVFDFNEDDNINICFNWKNLMPLEKYKNLSKKDKIIPLYVFHHERKLKDFSKIENVAIEVKDYLNIYSKYFKKFLNNS